MKQLGSIVLAGFVLVGVAQPCLATALQERINQDGQGLSVAVGGAGIRDMGRGGVEIEVDIQGPVETAILYWMGRDLDCTLDRDLVCFVPSEPYLDQEMAFEGTPITGTIVGTESQAPPQPYLSVAYAMNVTDIVRAKVESEGTGLTSFNFDDDNPALDFTLPDGVGLVVLYTDETNDAHYRVILHEGLDFAFGRADQLPSAMVTEPVSISHGAELEARNAEVFIFAGDAAEFCDEITITDTFGGVTVLTDELVGADGAAMDTLVVPVLVPEGGGTTTLQLFSPDLPRCVPAPDSLLWTLGGMRLPIEPPADDEDEDEDSDEDEDEDSDEDEDEDGDEDEDSDGGMSHRW